MTTYLSDVPPSLLDWQAVQRRIAERRRELAQCSTYAVLLRYGPAHGQMHHVASWQDSIRVLSTPGTALNPTASTGLKPYEDHTVFTTEYAPSGDYTLPHLIPVWTPIDHPSRKRSTPS